MISQIKQNNFRFRIIRHKQKMFHKESKKILQETEALIEGHFILSQVCTVLSMFSVLVVK